LNDAINRNKDSNSEIPLLRRRVLILAKIGRIAEAERDLAQTEKLGLNTGDTEAARGLICLITGQDSEARAHFEKAASAVNTRDKKAYYLENIGVIFLKHEDWQGALDWSEEVGKISQDGGDWNWLIMAIAAEKLGRLEERKDAVTQFLKRAQSYKIRLDDLIGFLPDDLGILQRD
jgi:tetratricopeptide (TPR) repeat protein